VTAAGDSAALPRLQYDRQHAIYMLALSDGSVDVSDLARRYRVSTETIRRDLSDMQARNMVRRVHGGAVPVERINHEPLLAARDMVNAKEKLRIATKAVEELPERGSVIIDSGSTTQRLAEVFPVERDLHVVTNSLMTALTLSRRGLRKLTVLGGAVRTNTLAMVDDTTRAELQHMAIDVLFISCDGLSFQHGLTTPYREEHTIKRSMIEACGGDGRPLQVRQRPDVQLRRVRRDRRARDRHARGTRGRRRAVQPRHRGPPCLIRPRRPLPPNLNASPPRRRGRRPGS
jgi:DeoR family transcriptional regulator, fructose operon transcriptional repressor